MERLVYVHQFSDRAAYESSARENFGPQRARPPRAYCVFPRPFVAEIGMVVEEARESPEAFFVHEYLHAREWPYEDWMVAREATTEFLTRVLCVSMAVPMISKVCYLPGVRLISGVEEIDADWIARHRTRVDAVARWHFRNDAHGLESPDEPEQWNRAVRGACPGANARFLKFSH